MFTQKGLPFNDCLESSVLQLQRKSYNKATSAPRLLLKLVGTPFCWQSLPCVSGFHCCVSNQLQTGLRQTFLCTGFCSSGFSWAVFLISLEVTHMSCSHRMEAGSQDGFAHIPGSSTGRAPGHVGSLHFFCHGDPAAGWPDIFVWWLKVPQHGRGGSLTSKH